MKERSRHKSRRTGIRCFTSHLRGRRSLFGMLALSAVFCLMSSAAKPAHRSAGDEEETLAPRTLEETRLTMGKWIETQQIISRERNDWQQGREILLGRLELVRREVATLEEKIGQAEASVAEADNKRGELLAENDELKSVGAGLTDTVSGMESAVRQLFKALPEPIQSRIQPLFQRVPEDPDQTRVTIAERFQNVLGIFDALNKANNEITVSYEVRTLADGKPSEVRAIYVGLAQAYYVSARGEAGVGRPTTDGWEWESSEAVADEVLMALEILQGKHTPAFVPLPVKLQ